LEAIYEKILGSDEANRLSAVKGDSGDLNSCGKMRENIQQKFVQNRQSSVALRAPHENFDVIRISRVGGMDRNISLVGEEQARGASPGSTRGASKCQ